MPFELAQSDGGLVLAREAARDIPTRCYCCSPAQRLRIFRNGPNTQLAVCPATRGSLILHDHRPEIRTGVFTGSLDGV